METKPVTEIESEDEFKQELNSFCHEIKKILIIFFDGGYDNFEDCYNCNIWNVLSDDYGLGNYDLDDSDDSEPCIHGAYGYLDYSIKERINRLITCFAQKNSLCEQFMQITDKMKKFNIELPPNFELNYHVQYHADRRGKGYVIVPYLSEYVAKNTADMEQQSWKGKYGKTIESSIVKCGGTLRLDDAYISPHKSFGIAIQDDHY